jgi:hypothetical protein
MTGEPVTSREIAVDIAERIVGNYVRAGTAIATCTVGNLNDWERGFAAGVDRIRHLHCAEPWLPAVEIIDTLLLAGWTPPADPGFDLDPRNVS